MLKKRTLSYLLVLLLASVPLMALGLATDADPARDFINAAIGHEDKVPDKYAQSLKYTLNDGTIRAILTFTDRDADTEADMVDLTTAHLWYGPTSNLLATVDAAQVRALLERDDLVALAPDEPLSYFTSDSTVATHARSFSSAGTGVWSYDSGTDSLVDDTGSFNRAITGKDVTISIADGGIDNTHADFDTWGCVRALPYVPCDSRVLYAGKVEGAVHTIFAGTLIHDIDDTLVSIYQKDLPMTTDLAGGHGTHVAGTALGNGYYNRAFGADTFYGGDGYVFGVAPESNLVSISNGETIWAGLGLGALTWTLVMADHWDIKVSSNSWGCLGGCGFSAATHDLAKDLYNAGVLVTFAVGNDGGSTTGPSAGASFSGYAQSPYILGVANYDDNTGRLSGSSSRGDAGNDGLPTPTTWDPVTEEAGGYTATGGGFRRPDISAPGTGIWAARSLTGGATALVPRIATSDLGLNFGGVREYLQISGTSMATPHVAGAIALLYDACPGATPLDVMHALIGNTQTVFNSGGGTAIAAEVGYGGLDVRAALNWLVGQLGASGCPP